MLIVYKQNSYTARLPGSLEGAWLPPHGHVIISLPRLSSERETDYETLTNCLVINENLQKSSDMIISSTFEQGVFFLLSVIILKSVMFE